MILYIKLVIMQPRTWLKDKPQRPKVWSSFELWKTKFSDTVEECTEDRTVLKV